MMFPKEQRRPRVRTDAVVRDFLRALWATFVAFSPTVQRGVVALVVLAAIAVTGNVFVMLAGVAIGWLTVRAARRKDDGLLEAMREESDVAAWEAAADDMFADALDVLASLVGTDVTLMVGAGGAAWQPVAQLCGVIKAGANVAEDPRREQWFFAVGGGGHGFFIERAQFVGVNAQVAHGPEGLTMLTADGTALTFYVTVDQEA